MTTQDTAPPNSTSTSDTTSNDTGFSCLYFGFASNLSPRSIKQRCPSAIYAGLGILSGYRFVISPLGFGNIVPSTNSDDVVYGSLNFLSARDEAALDKSEEVGEWHEKLRLKVKRLVPGQSEAQGQEVEVMTYVDVKRTGEGVISKEYIPFLWKAMEDGGACGVPRDYFERYWRKWLPEDEGVGREQKIVMVRTGRVDREDTAKVPSWLLREKK